MVGNPEVIHLDVWSLALIGNASAHHGWGDGPSYDRACAKTGLRFCDPAQIVQRPAQLETGGDYRRAGRID